MNLLDLKAMRRNFNRSMKTLAISQEVADNLLERLDYIKHQSQHILDLGCGTAENTYRLSRLYPKAKVIGIDMAKERLVYAQKKRPWFNKTRFVAGNMQKLPFADNSFDLIFSNLSLYWVEDLHQVFKEIQRVLKPEGVLLFSSLGPDSLKELRESFAQADSKAHVNVFLDMHDVGDAMLSAGLKDPVMDVETHIYYHHSVQDLLNELHQSGESNAHIERAKGLTGKTAFQKMQSHYENYRKSNKLPVSFEIVYGHALGTENLSRMEQGEVHIPLSQIQKRPKPLT